MSPALLILAQFIHSLDQSYQINQINTMNVAVQFLDQLFEDKPKVIAKNIDQLIATLEFLITQPDSCWLIDKAHFYDFLVSIVNKYPKLLKSQNMRGAKIFKLALDIVCQMSNEVSQEWMNPPDGFKDQEEQDIDSQTIKQIKSSIDALSETIGFEETLAHFQPLFLEYIQKKDDWRYQYASLIIASQIVNQEVNVDTISLIVQWAISMTEYEHPKVKYAALHLLGQYCQDLKNDFQEAYYNSLIPVTVRLLQDPVPRVVAHTFSCMSNFFEKCKALWRLQSILGQFLNPILHYIKNGNTWVKEAALTTLASFAHTEGAFGPNLPSVFQLCGDIINSCVGKEQYNQVLNQSFQMLSLLLSTQKKQVVQPYLNQFINLLYNHRDLIHSTYFLQAWNRICCEYESFTDLTQFYPHLMQKTHDLFVDVVEDDDCAQGLKCLTNTFLSFKTKAKLFAPQTLSFAKAVFQTSGSERVKEQAMILQAATVTAIKPNDPGELGAWFQQAYRFYEYLIALLQDRLKQPQFVVEEIPEIYSGLADIITSFQGCLSGPNLVALARKQFELVEMMEQNIESLKTETTENEDEYEDIVSDDSEMEIDKMCFDLLEDALERVPEVLQILLKACVEPTAKSEILELYQSHIQIYLTKQDPLVRFALSLTVEIIKSFTYYEIKGEYNNYMNLLSHYIQNPQPQIRNTVVYGFNLIFKKIPPIELGVQYVTKILELLSKSFTADFQDRPRDKDHLFFIKHCKDNVISALGNLLKYFGNSYPTVLNQDIYKFWVTHLPLEADKEEGNEQQEILIEFLNACPGNLINETKDLLAICEIYARFVMKRGEKQHKQIVEKTKQSLMMMKEWSLFKDSANYLWNGLSESHKQTLTRLMTD